MHFFTYDCIGIAPLIGLVRSSNEITYREHLEHSLAPGKPQGNGSWELFTFHQEWRPCPPPYSVRALSSEILVYTLGLVAHRTSTNHEFLGISHH